MSDSPIITETYKELSRALHEAAIIADKAVKQFEIASQALAEYESFLQSELEEIEKF